MNIENKNLTFEKTGELKIYVLLDSDNVMVLWSRLSRDGYTLCIWVAKIGRYVIQIPKMKIITANCNSEMVEVLDEHLIGRYSSRSEALRELIRDAKRFDSTHLLALLKIENIKVKKMTGEKKVVTINIPPELLKFLKKCGVYFRSRSELIRVIMSLFIRLEQEGALITSIKTVYIPKEPIVIRSPLEQVKFMKLIK
jgi:metal-responsive CopG/Arc/MetJ family transcriptional regulator